VAPERTLQHIRNSDALSRTRVEMLDKGHVDFAGQQGELHRAQLVESPALATASSGNGFVPHCRYFFAQRLVLDLHQWWKKLRNFIHAVIHDPPLNKHGAAQPPPHRPPRPPKGKREIEDEGGGQGREREICASCEN